jgi:pantoate--beta-alanine ligase
MNIVMEIREWLKIRKQLSGKTIGFVPTMGNLHSGHLSLCQRSKVENEVTLVSIFVNPVQFNQTSDFENYPRTLSKDKELLIDHKIDYLLLPDANTMYGDNYQIQVTETNLALELEGEFRPGHFNGMLTVVMKLLNLMQPARAYFGEKDYQQLLLVKKMVNALFLPTEIVACETVRAEDGLALSSRNSRLTPEQRIKSAVFPKLLQSSLGVEKITEQLKSLGFKVDYIAEKWERRLGAVWLDDVRLIDNVSIK